MYSNEDLDTLFHICSLFYTNQRGRIYAEYNHKISKEVATIIFNILENKEIVEMITKEDKEAVNVCEAMERYKQEIRSEGIKEGALDTLMMMTNQLIEKGFSDEMILSFKGITRQILKRAKESM